MQRNKPSINVAPQGLLRRQGVARTWRRHRTNMAEGSGDPSAVLVRPLCYVAPTPRLVWVRPSREVGSDPRAMLGPTHEQSWVRPTDGVGSDPRTRLGRTQNRSWVRPRIAPFAPDIHYSLRRFQNLCNDQSRSDWFPFWAP